MKNYKIEITLPNGKQYMSINIPEKDFTEFVNKLMGEEIGYVTIPLSDDNYNILFLPGPIAGQTLFRFIEQ